MLIELDELTNKYKLNVPELKAMVPKMTWQKELRKGTDVFYLGMFEDKDIKIKIKIRPSKMAQITESLKNRDSQGKAYPEGRIVKEQDLLNFGLYLETKVDDSFIKYIDTLIVPVKQEEKQVLSWE